MTNHIPGHVFHYRHGWIPLDHFAALQKAHGSHKVAAKLLAAAHAPDAGIRNKADAAKAALKLHEVPAGAPRREALKHVQAEAARHGLTLPATLRPKAPKNSFAEAGAREAQRKADALSLAKAERDRERAQRATSAPKAASTPKLSAFAQAGAREAQRKADALAMAKAEREREQAQRVARPVGPSPQEKIDNAAKMYGAGSPQHLAAQKRFAGPKPAPLARRPERERMDPAALSTSRQ